MRVDAEQELSWESMLAGIRAQAGWLAHGPAEALAAARAVLEGPPPPAIYLVGCGDSHYAGLAARYAFESWSGIPTHALPSLQFSRYDVHFAPPGSWVVCVSNSGRVARTIEAAAAARERGLRTVAVTYAADSRLATSCDPVLAYRYDDPGFGPGTLSYVASLASLYAIAACAAAADEHVERVAAEGERVAATIDACADVAAELGRGTSLDTPIRILGGGPSFATALFGRAKLIEAVRVSAEACELEEWAHEEYFCTGPGSLTLVLAPPGASADRAVEQLQAIRDVGGTGVAVCPAESPAAAVADEVLAVEGAPPEELSPLAYCVPLALFAYHFASTKGLTMLGFDDARRREINFRQIFGE